MEAVDLTKAAEQNRSEINALVEECGVKINDCYQCGKCAAGCPVAFAMDKTPRQIIRLLQLGLLDEALQAKSIWLCATCQTCSARCPNDVDPATLMETLRQVAKRKGIIAEKDMNLFNDIFLQNVKSFGKSPEVLLSALYNLRSGKLFQDIDAVPHLFLTGKAHVMPEKIKNTNAVRKIFEKSLKGGEGK